MRKRISLKTRRPDLSRQQFRDYYESHHVPLGLTFIDRFRWRRYVRNHVRAVSGAPVDFDCYAEFWVDDEFDETSLDRFIHSPDFRVLDEDDPNFLDVTRRLSFAVTEKVVKGPTGASESLAKACVVWRAGATGGAGVDPTADRIIASLVPRIVEAVLDTSVDALPDDAPFDTLLTIRLSDTKPIALDPTVAPEGRWSLIAIDPIETPARLLFFEEGDEPNQ